MNTKVAVGSLGGLNKDAFVLLDFFPISLRQMKARKTQLFPDNKEQVLTTAYTHLNKMVLENKTNFLVFYLFE